jgi:ATP-dependent RNA helicase DDX55/SPB4
MFNRLESFNVKELEVLVLDEADTLLDMGFRQEINIILGKVPKQRRTGLFSATQTKEVKELARAGMRNPVTVSVKVQQNQMSSAIGASAPAPAPVNNQITPSTLENNFMISEYDARPGLLVQFLAAHASEKIIVFVSSCACVDYYSNAFSQMVRKTSNSPSEAQTNDEFLPFGMNINGLHGKMVPKKRQGIYQKFCQRSAGVLFCTDVAARGIDIPDVEWIVQLSAPKDPAFFVHRVGRAARAGKRGGALIFVTEDERPYIELLRGRGIPLIERSTFEFDSPGFTSSDLCLKVLSKLKQLCSLDRELLEGGSTAFMSFLRSYKEHQCSYIFRLICRRKKLQTLYNLFNSGWTL